ncbi:MAG: prolyl oligopeptidase family serine peptidase [Propionibacteriaceae bacterium]|jgi:dipeptidyl aminopeptidase/acylaminoacyl peptidase|nr:prolyl oligopeptidase family serine peptidase [Propionibacteriaceae bacterium]
MTTVAPHGAWTSPIDADLVAGGAVGLTALRRLGSDSYWLVADPGQGGRVSLWRQRGSGPAHELTPHHNLRSSVHEYGGGAVGLTSDLIVFTDLASGRVHSLESGHQPRPISPAGPYRYGGFAVLPDRRRVVCLRQDSTRSAAQPDDALVVLDLDSANADGGRVLAQGADFYYAPQISHDGRVVWMEWDHPEMPWTSTRLRATDLDGGPIWSVAGDGNSAVVHPSWDRDGSIVYLSDASGHWNFNRWRNGVNQVLHQHPYDFCGPAWVLTPPPYALLEDGSIGCSWLVEGRAQVGRLRPDGVLERFDLDLSWADLGPDQPVGLISLGFVDRPSGLFRLDWRDGRVQEVARSAQIELDQSWVSQPRAFSWTGPDGPVHAWHYPPTNPNQVAPPGQRPPLLVTSHGGPTSYSPPDFSLKRLFWTSRGLGLLDVNYGGSTGYGRAYRERLHGRWGLTDVTDCVQGPVELARAGWADPARMAISGGSAGGFTTLAALCASDVFAAGISLYGVGDLEAMARDTHKFESHYLDWLVAPYPQGRQIYQERSPIHQLDRLNCPMLILQGADDLVVPPDQATSMAQAVRSKGLRADLVVYPGEGHGFRRQATICDQHLKMERFLGDVFGYRPAGAGPGA